MRIEQVASVSEKKTTKSSLGISGSTAIKDRSSSLAERGRVVKRKTLKRGHTSRRTARTATSSLFSKEGYHNAIQNKTYQAD